jgi:hypothetical protein
MSDKRSEQVPSVIWRGLFLFGHVPLPFVFFGMFFGATSANETALQQFEA